MDDIAGYETQNDLISWTPLLEEWLLATKRFYRLVDDANNYKDSERLHVSILTGSAWRCGWAAINEFRRKKQRESGNSTGRADLYLHSGDKQYLCEAKFTWDGFTLEKVNYALAEACNDAKAAIGSFTNEIPCGVVFISLSLPKSEENEEISSSILNVVETARTIYVSEGADLVAWSFPTSRRLLPGTHRDYNPGIIMIARVVPI